MSLTRTISLPTRLEISGRDDRLVGLHGCLGGRLAGLLCGCGRVRLRLRRLLRRLSCVCVGLPWACQAPSSASASIAANTAWMGMRPVATSWPPAWRTAEPNGAAQTFSQTNTAALVPG